MEKMNKIVEEIKKAFADHKHRDKIVAQYQLFYSLAGLLSGVLPKKTLISSVSHAYEKMNKTITFVEAKENEFSEEEMEDAITKAWFEDEIEAIEFDKQ